MEAVLFAPPRVVAPALASGSCPSMSIVRVTAFREGRWVELRQALASGRSPLHPGSLARTA